MHAVSVSCAVVILAAAVAAQNPAAPPIRNATAVPAKQLTTLRIGTVEATAVPGKPVELIVELTLAPKMHVYAPGQADYIPIALTLGESSDYAAAPAVYPASQSLFLEAISQTAKVYEKTFRITQRITVAATPDVTRRAAAGETLTIPATLRYQACDDAVCYRPETVKLAWGIRLQAR